MSVTFLHTADWQLGKPFARIADPHQRSLVQQERLNVLHRIGRIAQERRVAFIVVAGDLFDSPSPTKTTVSAACSAIGAMSVPVLAIPGNHDHGGPGSIWEQPFFQRERAALAPNLQVLTAPEPVPGAGAVVLPCPLLRRHESSDPTAWLRGRAPDDAAAPHLVLAHGSIQDFGTADDDGEGADGAVNRIDLSRLEAYDYVALGDWHGTRQVAANAWYAGTPELDRFPKGDAQQPGAVLVVTATRGAPPQVERVPTARFRWHQLAYSLTDDSGLAGLERQVATLLGTRAGEDLLRLELDGRLGIAASHRLEGLFEAWQARLLRLRLSNRVTIAPSEAELQALVGRTTDPLIARVAALLASRTSGTGEEADVARLALCELHAACLSRERMERFAGTPDLRTLCHVAAQESVKFPG
jgi:DNA repair exonuclease SbcCD nuclease subunit